MCSTCCKGCCAAFSRSALALFNLIDTLAGLIALAYGVYLAVSANSETTSADRPVQLTILLAMALGGLLLLCAILSFCGINFVSCRCSLSFSAWLSLVLALLELVIVAVFLTLKDKVITFVTDHQTELSLSDHGLDVFKQFYKAFVWGTLGLFVIEVLRFNLSRHLREQMDTDLEELRERLLAETTVEEVRERKTEDSARSKYAAIRKEYEEKYRSRTPAQEDEKNAGPSAPNYIDV